MTTPCTSGINLEMVQETLTWLRGRPQVHLPSVASASSIEAVVQLLVARKGGRNESAQVRGIVIDGGLRTVFPPRQFLRRCLGGRCKAAPSQLPRSNRHWYIGCWTSKIPRCRRCDT